MKKEELPDIISGMQVDVVVSSDYHKELTDIRRAVVCETRPNTAILTQPQPPFTRFYLNREMIITYLVYPYSPGGESLCDDASSEPMRIGVFAKLIDIIPYHHAESCENEQAVVMALKSGAELKNLRAHFRVRPVSEEDLAIYFEGKQMSVVDLSIGGAMLTRKEEIPPDLSGNIRVVVVIEGEEFELESRVVRVWSSYIDRRNAREYLSVQFLNMNKRLNYLLGTKIFGLK